MRFYISLTSRLAALAAMLTATMPGIHAGHRCAGHVTGRASRDQLRSGRRRTVQEISHRLPDRVRRQPVLHRPSGWAKGGREEM